MDKYTKEQQMIIDYWAAIEKANKESNSGLAPSGYQMERHLSYIQDYNIDHMMNLFYPADHSRDEKLPTIINIHGGGWLYGHVDDSDNYTAHLASRGYAVMGMGYRLIPATDLGGMVQDIYCSLHWLENYGEKRGFDLSRVLLTGDSAGAHLALLVACIQESRELQEIYGVKPFSFPLSIVGICCPALEMDHLDLLPVSDDAKKKRIRDAYRQLMLGEKGEAAPWSRAISFSEYVSYVEDASKLPPVFLIGSENESLYGQTKLLLPQFDHLSMRHEELIWKREDGAHLQHVFSTEHWEWLESDISLGKMLDFFAKNAG